MTLWESVQKNMTWRGVFIASIAAGTVFIVSNLILTPLVLDIQPPVILRYFASLLLGSDAVTDDGAFVQVIGLVIHFVLSFVFTLLITIVIHRWGILVGIIGGGLLGVAIYGINLYTFTVIFEWFFAIESNVLLLSHILFGATAGGVYELFDHYDIPFELEVNDEKN